MGIAVSFAVLAILSAHAEGDVPPTALREFDLLGYALLLGQALPLVWRTIAPRTVLWTITAFWFASAGLGYPSDAGFFPLIIALYTLGTYVPKRQALTQGALVGAVVVGWTLVGLVETEYVTAAAPVTVALAVILPIMVGLADNRRRTRLVELELSNQRRLHAQRIAAADAVRAERARIARELHDVVAHEMTVMTLQAEGARRRIADADPALAESLATISESGRKGLAEMQRMIGVLRTSQREAEDEAAELTGRPRSPVMIGTADQDDLAPMPSLAAIPALVQQVEDSGLPVHLTITGTTHVPAGVELSAYRIIQESLTNALKYAGNGASATVIVRRRRDAVTVEVEDDGRGAISDAVSSSGGNGLLGMRERVTALGGSIDVGPRTGGGFRVHAVLPVTDDQVGAGRRADTRPPVGRDARPVGRRREETP